MLLAAYAPGFMGRPVVGNINIGLILGLLQFVTTFVITALYIRYAERVLDPASSRIREHMETGGPAVSTAAAAAATETVGSPVLNLIIFVAFVAVTLAFVIRASKTNKSAADMYTGGAAFSGRQNGVAISGDYLSAASFLGIAGAIAINGYDGFLYSIGFLVAWLVALLLVAELLRNTGRFTMADVLSFRMREGPVRTAAATSTLAVSFFYLLAQMAGAGGLVALLMGINGRGGQSLVIAVVGC